MDSTNPWAKAGVMIRENLTPYSKNASVFITPNNGVTFQWRSETDGPTSNTNKTGITTPQYLKLQRTVNWFEASHSSNGIIWEDACGPDDDNDEVIEMAPGVYVGFAVTSHTALEICTADFNDMTVYGWGEGAAWNWGNIGTNDREQMYIALEDTYGNITVVDHPDPNASTITNWQEWNIELKEFTNVDMNTVSKMYIGFGDRDNPQAGGSGKVYFDDIRLHPTRCTLSLRSPDFAKADYNEDCEVNYEELAAMAEDWLFAAVPPSDANLLMEYTFDADLTDTSDNSYHGVAVGNPIVSGGILTLDGLSWVDIPFGNDNPFDGTRDFSIAMQFRTEQPSILISSARDDTSTNHSMSVYVHNWDEPDWGEVLYDNFHINAVSAEDNPLDGDWHTMVTTYEAATQVHRMYLDGVPGESLVFDPAIPQIRQDTVRIGGSLNITFPYEEGVGDLAGDIDNVRIYDNVLSHEEVLYLAGAPVTPADLDGNQIINFGDFAFMAKMWLEEQFWP